jgi:uncharacterized protein (TIGR03435 family)
MIAKWLLAILCPALAAAQTAPAFEVASIKAHPGEITFSSDPSIKGSQVVATAVTLRDLLTYAYAVRYDQLDGAPPWAGSEHYDLVARGPGDQRPTVEQAREMMRTLLAERFQLQTHRETRDVPSYALVVAKGGHKLKPSTEPTGGGHTRASAKGMHMETTRGTTEALASQLSNTAGRPVVNRTGLDGYWAYTFDWIAANRPVTGESDAPSMFTAIQEQLGLKLEPVKAPFDMLIVDRAERPSQN